MGDFDGMAALVTGGGSGIGAATADLLAEQVPVPVGALVPLPDTVGPAAGALVEPGGNALRAVEAARLEPGEWLLVWGPGTIGLLAAMFAAARGAEVHVVGRDTASLALARDLGADGAWTAGDLPGQRYDAVIDATNDPDAPRLALEAVEPGRRLVYIGLAGRPSHIDTRDLALKDVTAVGILGGSAGLRGAAELYASGQVDPGPLVAATVGLDQVAGVLAGDRPPGAGRGPKVQVDPRR